jgi:hypothetical protein
MRSHIGIGYWAAGQPAGDPWFINEVDAHPGVEDAWDKITAALAAVYAVIQTGFAGAPALAKPLMDIINGADYAVERHAEHFWGDDGWAGNMPDPGRRGGPLVPGLVRGRLERTARRQRPDRSGEPELPGSR